MQQYITLSPITMVQWKIILHERKRSYWRYTPFSPRKKPWLWEKGSHFLSSKQCTYPPNVAEFFFLWSSGETRILWREVSWHATLVKSCGLKRVPKTIGSWGGREKFGRLLQMSLCSGVVFVDYSIKLGVAWKTHERIQRSMKTVQPVCSNYNILFF